MAGITLAEAQTALAAYQAAEIKALQGQAYSIAGRSMSRANLTEIRKGIEYYSNLCRTLSENADAGYIQSQLTINDD